MQRCPLMPNRERRKGVSGEAEVRAIYEAAGLTVRGLEGGGDHVVFQPRLSSMSENRPPLWTIHSEVKWQETARVWAWWEQAESETPEGSMTVVAFRRNRSPWLALVRLDDLAGLLR